MPIPTDADAVLADVLAHRGWERREGQVSMVAGIAAATPGASGRVDVAVNAPVGTGKTLAYVIAALARGQRVVIATSTKSLQDQVMSDELPRLAGDLKALYDHDLTYSVLKGKSTYLCAGAAQRLLAPQEASREDDLFADLEVMDVRDEPALGAEMERLALQRASGSHALDSENLFPHLTRSTAAVVRASTKCFMRGMPWVRGAPEDIEPEVWAGAAAEVFEQSPCGYRAAYARAMLSQVVVMNSTLLAHEIVRARTKWNVATPALLEGVGVVVVDEAHHLARILAETYSTTLDFHALGEIVAESVKVAAKASPEGSLSLGGISAAIEDAAACLEVAIDDAQCSESELREAMTKALYSLVSRAGSALGSARARAGAGGARSKSSDALGAAVARISEDVLSPVQAAAAAIGKRNDAGKFVNNLAFSPPGRNLEVRMTPVDVSFFRSELTFATGADNPYTPPRPQGSPSVVVLSSGTITRRVATSVGMRASSFVTVDSPFDDARARLCIPTLPPPSDPGWFPAAWAATKAAITAAGGRTMILTTSHARCTSFTEAARAELDMNVLSQSDARPKRDLVQAFAADETSVLVGTISFWEGVDVPGPALSLVVMDKMPFPMPDDAIASAQRAWVEENKGNAFMEVDVDRASIMIAQGAGRLIRATSDAGGVMLLDSRAVTARYGPAALGLLPGGWAMTGDLGAFTSFLSAAVAGTVPGVDWSTHRLVRPGRARKLIPARR